MESVRTVPRRGADCATRVSVRPNSLFSFVLALCFSFLAPVLFAQPVAGSITTHALPFAAVSPYIDAAGNVYTTGASDGSGVTAGAAQTQTGGGTCYAVVPLAGATESFPCADAYIAKADASGNLIFGTLLGGPTDDYGTALAVDAAGNVLVAGHTSGSFPTTPNAAIANGGSTAFAAKLSADGSRFLYATYLPDDIAVCAAIAVDAQGNAYVVGSTKGSHAFVAKLNPDGSAILSYLTLSGSSADGATAAVVDAAGNLLIAGFATSPDFPVTSGVVQPKKAGEQNLFITKLNPAGGIIFSTYLGGEGIDSPNAIRTDSAGNIYVAGATTSQTFPSDGLPRPLGTVPLWSIAGPGGFAASLSPDASTVRYSRFIDSVDNGGAGLNGVTSLAVTAAGDAYVTGVTGAGFPATASAPQICFQGPVDAFVEHLDANGLTVDATYAGGSKTENPQGLAVESDGSVLLQTYTFASAPRGTVEQIRFGGGGWTAPSCLSANPANAATLYSDGSVAPGEFISLTGLGIGPDAGVAYTAGAQWQPPLQLAGVQVFFDGQAAPLFYVQSRQINVQAPFELTGKTSSTIQVQYGGFSIGSITVPVNYAVPGIFRVSPGISTQAVAVNQNGTVNNASNPAAPGSIVSIWGTGFGSLVPPCATGGLNPYAAVDLGATVTLEVFGGPNVPATYAGSAPGMACGVEQVNLTVPDSAHGTYAIQAYVSAIVNGATSSYFYTPVGATIAVQ